MWDDRFLFVTAALIAIAITLEPRMARLQRTVRFGRQNVKVGSIIVIAIALLLLLVVGSQIWYHWHESFLPKCDKSHYPSARRRLWRFHSPLCVQFIWCAIWKARFTPRTSAATAFI